MGQCVSFLSGHELEALETMVASIQPGDIIWISESGRDAKHGYMVKGSHWNTFEACALVVDASLPPAASSAHTAPACQLLLPSAYGYELQSLQAVAQRGCTQRLALTRLDPPLNRRERESLFSHIGQFLPAAAAGGRGEARDALESKVTLYLPWETRVFCSKLVAEALVAVGRASLQTSKVYGRSKQSRGLALGPLTLARIPGKSVASPGAVKPPRLMQKSEGPTPPVVQAAADSSPQYKHTSMELIAAGKASLGRASLDKASMGKASVGKDSPGKVSLGKGSLEGEAESRAVGCAPESKAAMCDLHLDQSVLAGVTPARLSNLSVEELACSAGHSVDNEEVSGKNLTLRQQKKRQVTAGSSPPSQPIAIACAGRTAMPPRAVVAAFASQGSSSCAAVAAISGSNATQTQVSTSFLADRNSPVSHCPIPAGRKEEAGADEQLSTSCKQSGRSLTAPFGWFWRTSGASGGSPAAQKAELA